MDFIFGDSSADFFFVGIGRVEYSIACSVRLNSVWNIVKTGYNHVVSL